MGYRDDWSPRKKKERHAQNRIMERFGVRLTVEQFRDIRFKIEEGVILPVWISRVDGRSFHPFVIQGVSMILLYDWEYGCILTAYRKKWFDTSDYTSWTLKPRR